MLKTRIFLLFFLVLGACVQNSKEKKDQTSAEVVKEDSLPAKEFLSHQMEDTRKIAPDISEAIQLSWETLAAIDFEYSFVEELGAEVPFPIFTDTIKKLEGKWVEVEGYLIPVSETGDETIIVLSAFPYSQCFFCGGAGPESVIDILPASDPGKLKMDQVVAFRGKLKLNDSDFDYLNYILEEAEFIE
jgi:hypothetical protein